MTDDDKNKAKLKKYARYAAAVGMLLALACQSVPSRYQSVCNVVAQVIPHACG